MTYDEAVDWTKQIYTSAINVKRNIMNGPQVSTSLLEELYPELFGPLDVQKMAQKMLNVKEFEPVNFFNLVFLANRVDLIVLWFENRNKKLIEPDVRWMKGFE